MQPLSTPDVTLVQKLVVAIGGLIGALLVALKAFGVDITDDQALAIGGLWTAFSAVLVIADAIIRNGRSRAMVTAPKGAAYTEEKAGA